MTLTLVGSTVSLIPFNRFINFGSGFSPFLAKVACNVTILVGPSIYAHSILREKLVAVKKKVYGENKSGFLRYELIGDVPQVRDDYELVEE